MLGRRPLLTGGRGQSFLTAPLQMDIKLQKRVSASYFVMQFQRYGVLSDIFLEGHLRAQHVLRLCVYQQGWGLGGGKKQL